MSILLIVVCLFSLVAVAFGVKDCLEIKAYKEEDAKRAEAVNDLEDALVLLKDNEQAYLDGIGAYTKGLSDYQAGQQELSKGYKDYDAGKKTLEAGYKTYNDGLAAYEQGKKDLEEGKKQVAEGQALIDANTEAYIEGKAKLEKIEPLLPYVDTYVEFRDGFLDNINGFTSAQIWFVTVVRPIAARLGLEIPLNVIDFPGYIQQMVADGKAQIKEYEDGLATLEAGKAQVADGERQLAEAEKQLADGKKELEAGEKELAEGKSKLLAGESELAQGKETLASGKASLEEFEDGMRQVDGYLEELFTQASTYRHNGELAVPNPQLRLGEDYSWYKLNDNGEIAALRSGDPYIDLDKGMEVCKAFREYVADSHDDVAKELYSRFGTYIALAIGSILGIVVGILGLCGTACVVPAMLAAVLGLGANIFGLCSRYLGYTYPLKDGTYSGTLQLVALLFFAVLAITFAVEACVGKAKYKAAKE